MERVERYLFPARLVDFLYLHHGPQPLFTLVTCG
jgi:hypothetical protein